jgi:hypothetical protein
VGEDPSQSKQRPVTVAEAAETLGISAEAVRSRLKRGKLPSVKEGATVYVLLDADQTPPEQSPNTAQTTDRATSDTTALISAKDETIALLRQQLEAERQSSAELRRIVAALTSRIPELPSASPQEPVEAPETDTESRVEPTPSEPTEGPMAEGAQRSWWRRVFGG